MIYVNPSIQPYESVPKTPKQNNVDQKRRKYFDELFCPLSASGVCVPIVDYEVLQKRKKYTEYKLHVITSERNWFVFRTYRNFVVLNKELRKQFPSIGIKLPKRRIFCSSFSTKFLERRRKGLQMYMDAVMQHDNISRSNVMKDFLQLSNPPGPYDCFEQSKLYCEEMEHAICKLNTKIEELQSELGMTKSRLTQALIQQKVSTDVEAKELQSANGKNEIAKGMVFPALADSNTLKQTEGSIY